MTDRWERWAAGSGVVFVAAAIVAYIIMGNPPGTDEGGPAIASWFTDNRGSILTGAYIYGIALVAFLWFVGTLTAAIREAGQSRLATIAATGGVVAAALYMASMIGIAALAHRIAADGDEGVVSALFDVSSIGYTMTSFPVVVLTLATAIATLRSGLFPQWFAGLSGLAAIWYLIGGATYSTTGFFAPDGGWGMIGFFVFMAWTLIASGLLLQRQAATAPRPATAM
jgi:hypothetical protein